MRACQIAERPRDLLGQPERLNTSLPQSISFGWTYQRRRFKSCQHLAPRLVGTGAITFAEPGDKTAIRGGGGQSLPAEAGEDLLEQDRHRPAVEHDVVSGQHEPMPIVGDAHEHGPESGLVLEIADRRTFAGADLLDATVDTDAVDFQLDVAPGRHGISGNDLHRLLELCAESGRQLRMSADHRLHRFAQPPRVERATQRDIQLHRIDVVGSLCGVGVEEQALLQGGQRQDVGDRVLPAELVDLVLAQLRGGDIRRSQSAATASHMLADADQSLEPQPVQSTDLLVIERRSGPRPVGVQLRAGVCFEGGCVEFDGMPE